VIGRMDGARRSGSERAAEDDATSLRDYVAVLRRRWPIIVFFTCAVPAAAVALSLSQSPLYSANADVLISQSSLGSIITGTQLQVNEPVDRYAQTQVGLAREPAVAALVLRRASGVRSSISGLLSASSVSVRENSDILTFRVSDRQASEAAALATAYAQGYVAYRRQLDTSALQGAGRSVAVQLAQLRATGQERSPLYADLLARQQQIRTLETLQTPDAVVVRTATSARKVRPRPQTYAGFGVAAGLLLGLLFAFLLEALDTRIRSDRELTDALGLPLLGRTPQLRGGRPARGEARLPVMLADPASSEAEAFRRLRVGIDLANVNVQATSLLITSALPGEGKTTVASNLAVAFARTARRTTLLDLDLRNPSMARSFGLRSDPGLTECALGEIEVRDAIIPFDLSSYNERYDAPAEGSLDVMPTGQLPSDAGAFIESPVVSRLLSELQERSDILLIDSAPLLSAGDTASLFAKVDAVIVVANRRILSRSSLEELKRVLGTSPAVCLGVVIAGVEGAVVEGYVS
jgi:succinoglycan biosynthesis transport protein ExoP